MAKTDDEIENPLIGHEFRYFGDRFRILESSRDTDDGSLRAEYFAAPRVNVPEHVHHPWEDCFEVLSGTLGLRVGGQELTLGPGQSAVVPPGVSHAWWNPSDEEEVRYLVEIRPGLDVETMLETVLSLARDGKTVGGMIPRNPLQLAVLAHEFGSWGYFTGIPRSVRKTLFAPVASLAFVGRMFGYRARYPKYSGSEAAETVRIEQSVEFERPPEEVFSFVADPRNDERWTPAVEETRKTSDGSLGAGTTFESVFRLLGRRFEATFEIAEYEPNRKVVLGSATSRPLQLTGTRSVEVVPGGTQFTIRVEVRSGGFFGVAEPVFARLAERPLKVALANLKNLLEGVPAESEPMSAPPEPDRLLPLVSVLWLLNSAFGAAIAIREDLPAKFAGMSRWHDPSADFFRGSGTALSPGLPMMAALAVFTLLSQRGGRAGTVGVVGMTMLEAGATIGVLGEPITHRTLSPTTFDPAKTPIVSAAVVLSPLMATLGARRLFILRSER